MTDLQINNAFFCSMAAAGVAVALHGIATLALPTLTAGPMPQLVQLIVFASG